MKPMSLDRPAALRTGISPQTGNVGATNDSPFLDILQAASENQSVKVSDNSALPIGKDKLLTMVRLFQFQMNRRLINAVMSPEGSTDNPVSGFGVSSLPPALFNMPDGVSKNQPQQVASAPATVSAVKKAPWRRQEGFDNIIERASRTYQVDPDLIRAVIKTESNFNPDAVSPKGARGLMQLMPATARDLGVKDPHDPEENIMAGTRYLKGLLERYDGNVDLALAAYNWGMGNVERNPDRMPRETLNYVARINRYYQG